MKPFLSSQHSEDSTFSKRLGMTSGPSPSLAGVLMVPVRTLGSKDHFTLLHRQTISSSTALIFSNTWRRAPLTQQYQKASTRKSLSQMDVGILLRVLTPPFSVEHSYEFALEAVSPCPVFPLISPLLIPLPSSFSSLSSSPPFLCSACL